MLRQRLAAAALGLPMLVMLLWLNWILRRQGNLDDLPLLAIVLLIAGGSGWEVSQIVRRRFPAAAALSGLYAALIIPFIVHAVRLASVDGARVQVSSVGLLIDSLGVTAAVMLLFLAVYSDLEQRGRAAIVENFIVLVGGAFLGGTLSCLLLLGETPLHEIAVGFIFMLVFGLDTAAYFGGRQFGGWPLAPKISPKKTVSGAICGLLATIALAFVFKAIPSGTGAPSPEVAAWWNLGAQLDWTDLLWLGLCIGFLGQLGDLVESAFKRWGGVKDSGSIIPGHGGFLDRFDSLLLAAPAYYLLLERFLHLP
jgi:phosphatidate cytidylyltransferase